MPCPGHAATFSACCATKSFKMYHVLSRNIRPLDCRCVWSGEFFFKKKLLQYLWVIYNIWKMTPLGAMWFIHGNYFVTGGAPKRKRVLEDFKLHLKKNYWKYNHRWIIMYPEGNFSLNFINSHKLCFGGINRFLRNSYQILHYYCITTHATAEYAKYKQKD